MSSIFMLPPAARPTPFQAQCRRYTTKEWDVQRSKIKALYVHQCRTLKDVMRKLEESGFTATEKQLKSRISKWGFDTKNVKGDVMIELARTWVKRKRDQATGNSFRVNKRPVDERKISRYLKRKGISEEALLSMKSPICASAPEFTIGSLCLPSSCSDEAHEFSALEAGDGQSLGTSTSRRLTIPSMRGPESTTSSPEPDSWLSQFRHHLLHLEQECHGSFVPEAIPNPYSEEAPPPHRGEQQEQSSHVTPGPPRSLVVHGPMANPVFILSPSSQDILTNLNKLLGLQTCGIFFTLDQLNPFRDLIWSLAAQSKALYHAVAAMTASIMFHGNSQRLNWEQEHVARSMTFLQDELRGRIDLPIETAIATSLLLSMTKARSQMTPKRFLHSSTSTSLITIALYEYRRRGNPTGLRILFDTWIHMDILGRFLSTEGYEPTEFNAIFSALYQSLAIKPDSKCGPIQGTRNFILLISQVATLCGTWSKLNKYAKAGELDTTRELERQLRQWQPRKRLMSESSSSVHSSTHMADAFRYSAIIVLQQMVSDDSSLTLTGWRGFGRAVIKHLKLLPVESHLCLMQIFPLLVAGCEVDDADDREWVRRRWELMSQRLCIDHVDHCHGVVEEVWRRRDSYRKMIDQCDVPGGELGELHGLATELGAFRNWKGVFKEWQIRPCF